MTDTEVTIIGGGVHGTHLAIRLLNAGIVDRQRLRILDPNGLQDTVQSTGCYGSRRH
ncbi:hypothetical protein [Halalkalicoccus tibetensis]|uniref:FAD dependent oxidoreductase n=1 Tax=Halalkalicoccus tibetensis TaxID=175632 RepID=A0ABD5V8L3_9EURY